MISHYPFSLIYMHLKMFVFSFPTFSSVIPLFVSVLRWYHSFWNTSGGQSFGCAQNAGAAGTIYDSSLQTLKVSNGNFTTHTETPLLGFPMTRLWSNVLVECNARVLVPLLWSRVQVCFKSPINILLTISFYIYVYVDIWASLLRLCYTNIQIFWWYFPF